MSNLIIKTNDSAPRSISILAGVIRRINNKWVLLNDAGHRPIGLNPNITEPNSRTIQVMFDKTYSQVLSCAITPDDTYAERGIVFGASVSLDKVYIKHSRAGVIISNTELSIPSSNIWIYIMMYD